MFEQMERLEVPVPKLSFRSKIAELVATKQPHIRGVGHAICIKIPTNHIIQQTHIESKYI